MTSKYLFGAEVDQIQDTLFRAARQRQVVGGSQLLAEFGQQAAKLAKAHGAADEDVLIHAGGNFRILFPSEKQANAFGRNLANAYRLLLDASITIADPEPVNGKFPEANDKVGQEIRRLKRSQRGQIDTPHAPSIAFCQSSGVGLASKFERPAGPEERQYLSEFAWRMGEAAGRIRQEAEGKDEQEDTSFLGQVSKYLPEAWRKWCWADVVDDIADLDGERANVAYLVADGNGMGELFGKCDADQLKQLSKALDEAIRQALTAGYQLKQQNKSDVTSDQDKADDELVAAPITLLIEQLQEARKYSWENFLPLLPLILAGDDVFVLLPAVYALDFAQRFCLAFEHFMGQSAVVQTLREINPTIPPPTMAAAIVFCKGSYPYHLAHHRGENLLKQAKQLVKIIGLESGDWHSALAFDFIIGNELVSDTERSVKYYPSLNPYWVVKDPSQLGAKAGQASVALDDLLKHRWRLHSLSATRLTQIRNLFASEQLPKNTDDLPSWNARLNKLQQRIEVSSSEGRHLVAFNQALTDLGNRSNLAIQTNPGHWRTIERAGKRYQAHGLPDLIMVWNYAQSLDYPLSVYSEEEE